MGRHEKIKHEHLFIQRMFIAQLPLHLMGFWEGLFSTIYRLFSGALYEIYLFPFYVKYNSCWIISLDRLILQLNFLKIRNEDLLIGKFTLISTSSCLIKTNFYFNQLSSAVF